MNPYELLCAVLRKLKRLKGVVSVTPIMRRAHPPQTYEAALITKDYNIQITVSPR